MKVVFLDFDGVLNRGFGPGEPELVAHLNTITDRTGAGYEGADSVHAPSRSKVKVVPSLGAEVNRIVPPIFWMMACTRAKPTPVPL
jgi:hypothetical protein